MPEYKILRVACFGWEARNKGQFTTAMEQLVARHLAEGWIPLGGLAVEVHEGATDALLQTMYRNLAKKP